MDAEQLLALEKPLIKPSVVAGILGVSRSTVYRWFWEGRLNGVKVANSVVRISRESVAALLAKSSLA
jgi:excisionase family DNA binding protein